MNYTLSMAKVSVFLPSLILSLLKKGEKYNTQKGLILFCDVAGFTPLTESLSKMGKEGAERLTLILNNYFDEMIKIVERYEGDILRFGGDAITVFFEESKERNGLICAKEMLKKMEDFKELNVGQEKYSLSMKIGVSSGEIIYGLLGHRRGEYDYFVAGIPLDDSAEAEHNAQKGQIVLHPQTAEIFKDYVSFLENGFGVLTNIENQSQIRSENLFSVNIKKADEEKLMELLPPYLIDRAGEGTLGENRSTTVIFLSFKGFDKDLKEKNFKAFYDNISALYDYFLSTIKSYGGIVNKIDMGDKGMKAIILFGSPYAIEKKEEMAVRCALEVTNNNPYKNIDIKIGITTSHLFTGAVGSSVRREFTVMGDGINTAARLMQKCEWGQILCDKTTKEGSREEVFFKDLPPVLLKGKEKEVPIFSPEFLTRRDISIRREEIIERDEELAKIKNVLLLKSKPLLIVGDTGLGKTTLIEYTKAEAEKLAIPVTRVFLAFYHMTRPFSLWKGAFRSIIGAKKEDSPETVKILLERKLSEDEVAYYSLLGAPLGVSFKEDAPLVENLSSKDKKELTFALMEKIISTCGERIVLADNLEYSDPMSLEFLSFLLQGGKCESLKIVASARQKNNLENIISKFDVVKISPFTEEGERLYLERRKNIDKISEKSFSFLRTKTSGNPKFVNAIVDMLKREGVIVKDGERFYLDEDRLFKLQIPQSLEEIYLKKVDLLPREERELVQSASVLGYSISLSLLAHLLGKERSSLKECFDKLVEKEIFLFDSWGERPYYKFTDGFLRDAVYESAPFSLKRDIHFKCASFLEKESESNARVWQLIANHYKGAGEKEKAVLFQKKCAYDAISRYDNVTAMKYLEEICSEGITKENLDCAFNLIKVFSNLGKREDEEKIVDEIEKKEIVLDNTEFLQFLLFKIKWSVIRGEISKAENLFEEAENFAKKTKQIKFLAEIYVNKAGGFYGPRGDLQKAKESLEKCFKLPDLQEILLMKITALYNYAIILRHEGSNVEALKMFKRAYIKAKREKLLPQIAMIANNIVPMKYDEGKYKNSIKWLKIARKSAEIFSLRNILLSIEHLDSIIDLSEGRIDIAKERLYKNAENCKRFGNRLVEAISFDALIETSFLNLDLNSSLNSGKEALYISMEDGNAVIFKGTLIEVLKIHFSLKEKNEALKCLINKSITEFFKNAPPHPSIDCFLNVLIRYFEGQKVDFDKNIIKEISARLLPDYLLFFLEKFIDEGEIKNARNIIDLIFAEEKALNYFSNKIKIYLFLEKIGDERKKVIEREVIRKIKFLPFGIYGLRILYYLHKNTLQQSEKKKIRSLFIKRLYFLKTNSPEWVFQKVLNFDEVKIMLKGE